MHPRGNALVPLVVLRVRSALGSVAGLPCALACLAAIVAYVVFFGSRLSQTAALLTLAALPLVLAPDKAIYVGLLAVMGLTSSIGPGLTPSEELKGVFNVPLLLFPLLSIAWLVGVAGKKPDYIVPNPVSRPLVAFFAVAVFSSVANWGHVTFPHMIVGSLLMIIVISMSFVLGASVVARAGHRRDRVVLSILLAGALAMIWSCKVSAVEFAPSSLLPGYASRLSPIREQLNLVPLGVFGFLMSFGFMLEVPKPASRLLALLGLLTGGSLLLWGWSRASFVGVGIAVGVMVFYRWRRLAWALAYGSAIAGVLIAAPVVREGGFHAFTAYAAGSRFVLWHSGLEIALERPLQGVGLGQFSRFAPWGVSAHNNYINVAAETGFAGLAALVWLLLSLWQVGLRLRRAADTFISRAFSLGLLGVITSCAVASLFGEGIMPPYANRQFDWLRGVVYLWLLAGMGAGWTHARKREQVRRH